MRNVMAFVSTKHLKAFFEHLKKLFSCSLPSLEGLTLRLCNVAAGRPSNITLWPTLRGGRVGEDGGRVTKAHLRSCVLIEIIVLRETAWVPYWFQFSGSLSIITHLRRSDIGKTASIYFEWWIHYLISWPFWKQRRGRAITCLIDDLGNDRSGSVIGDGVDFTKDPDDELTFLCCESAENVVEFNLTGVTGLL